VTKIAAIEPVVVNVSPKTNWTFIAVADDAGETAWGECSLNGWEPLLVAYAAVKARDLIGCDIDDMKRRLRYLPHSPGGVVAHAVRSAIEQGSTDLRASRRSRHESAPDSIAYWRCARQSATIARC